MKYLLHILIYLCVAVGVNSHADSVGELYWKTVLPNARMPNAIKSLLTSDQSNVLRASSSSSSSLFPSSPFDNKIGGEPFDYHYASQKDDPPYPFDYHYAGKKPLKKRSNITIFFMEKDLDVNKKMNLYFANNNSPLFSSSTFLRRQKSDSIPFSSAKLPEIFTQLSINHASRKAQFIKNTINRCEEPTIKGEDRLCATSLEAMIDFSLSKLGNITNDVEAISTETLNATTIQKYTINSVKEMGGDSSVVCHKQKYPYAVFYCHKTSATQVYMVSLGGDHGGEAEAAAVCHNDTSAWNPNHLSFLSLNVHPGTAPICHFLPEDHVVWIKHKAYPTINDLSYVL